jgi:hypothetical protein
VGDAKASGSAYLEPKFTRAVIDNHQTMIPAQKFALGNCLRKFMK